ncbi:MAG: thioredoxin domain-containing protein, partial [Solirubrobacteraceae bacterium]|nr:thioredoxin domain-containing protein [Solirubrobacteraceae bacterium]
MASNADKKNEARLKREQAQLAAAAQAKRTKLLQYLGGAVFAALVVVVLVVVITGGKDSGGGVGTDEKAEVAGTTETASLLKGIEQNGLTIGDPKAPVTLIEFIDVQCPFCKDHQLDQQPKVINDLVRTGKARLRLAPIALSFMGEDSEAGRTVAV